MTLIDNRSVSIVTDNLLRVSGYVHVVFHGTHVIHIRHTIANLRSDCRVINNLSNDKISALPNVEEATHQHGA